MGNNSAKKQTCPYEKNVEELFSEISNKKKHILRSDLRKAWLTQIDENLYNDVETYLFRANHNELSSQSFKKFFADICKGTTDQKVEVLCNILGDNDNISKPKLLKFMKGIILSILIIQKSKSSKKYESWSSRMSEKLITESLNDYGMYFLNRIDKNEDEKYSRQELNFLLNYFDFFFHMVISRLYDSEEKHFYTNLLPKWKNGLIDPQKTLEQFSILNLCKIIFLNFELPTDYQNEWRPLFSSKVDGESFSRLTGQILNQGPTIILVKDKDGHSFGGFASTSWSFGPKFFGDSRSFLFTLEPEMNLYVSTNFNNNYQYCNISQQTLPNGLGMGGQLEYFGLWIDAEFGKGYCSESCTTFRDYKMMSAKKNFEIAHLEVWGVGQPPLSPSELGERSVLDGNLEAKAILEMAGKTAFSDGLRDDIDN